MKDEKDFTIPSREEHTRFIRKIWKGCLLAALFCFLSMATVVVIMAFMGYDPQKIVSVMLIAVYIVVPVYGVGYIGPAFATSLIKMALAVDMSRQGLVIGKDTADILTNLKKDVEPLVEDAKKMMSDLKPMIEEFRKQDLGKVHKVLERFEGEMNGGGKLDRLVTALEKIAKRTDQKADDALGDLLEEAWRDPKKDNPEGT
jgi:hypothetical protein